MYPFYFGAPKKALGATGGAVKKPTKGVSIVSAENRRDLNAPYTLVYPNPSQNKNNNYSGVYRNQLGNMQLLENPGSGKNNGLVWYYYDPVNGSPYDPLTNRSKPTIAGNKVDLVNSNFALSGDPRSTELNPYLYVCVKKNEPLRTSEISPGKFDTTKLDVVSVIGHDGKKGVVKFAGGGGGQPIYYFTLHLNLETGGFEKWYGMFAPYVPTPPPSPSRSSGFGKRKGVKKSKSSLGSLKRDLKKLLKM
jgi:hypothetical protein